MKHFWCSDKGHSDCISQIPGTDYDNDQARKKHTKQQNEERKKLN